MDLGLSGKTAIVTGGSSGIGLATARLLLEEGTRVAICARGEERLRTASEALSRAAECFAGGRAVYAEAVDVTDRRAVEAFVDRTAERFGGVDILVNNAGGGRASTFATTSDDAWRAELELKLFSVVNPTRAVHPHMKARGGGSIVNVNAILARQPEPHMVATSAARAGVLNLARSLAGELAADGILVNTVSLGLVDSDQWRRRHAEGAADVPYEDYLSQVARERGIPLGRAGRPEEVAAAIVFLVSPRASYISGAVLDIGGGVHRYA